VGDISIKCTILLCYPFLGLLLNVYKNLSLVEDGLSFNILKLTVSIHHLKTILHIKLSLFFTIPRVKK